MNKIKTLLFLFVLAFPVSALSSPRDGAIACVNSFIAGGVSGIGKRAQAKVHVPTVAAKISWIRWGERWRELSDQKRTQAIRAVKRTLQKMEDSVFANIDTDTISFRKGKELSGGFYELPGKYKKIGSSDEELPENFALFIRPKDCFLSDIEWNNVRLSCHAGGDALRCRNFDF